MTPQMTAYYSLADFLFFGGAAGGGKTGLLLGVALTQQRLSLILRREFPQLREAMDQAKEIIGKRGQYSFAEKRWSGLPGKRSLEFGAVNYYKDCEKYQGRPHDFIGFDEISQFSEIMVRFLLGWLRTKHAGQRTRMIGAGNPPTTEEGVWVVNFWGPWLNKHHPNPAVSGEIRYFAVIEGRDIERETPDSFYFKKELIFVRSRSFVKATLEDNPIHSETPDYGANLQAMPEPLRSQMRYGDFQKGLEDNAWQVFPTSWVQAAMALYDIKNRPAVQTSLGIDIARGGQDKTVFAPIYGRYFVDKLFKYPGNKTPDGSSVADLCEDHHQDNADINLDIIGIGTAAYDELVKVRYERLDDGTEVRRSRSGKMRSAVYPINFGSTEGIKDLTDKTGKLGFVNIRAHAFWCLREVIDPANNTGFVLPPDSDLMQELTAHRFSVQLGKILIIGKDRVVEKIGHSPDCADAVVYANYSNHMKKSFMGVILQGTTKGWNP